MDNSWTKLGRLLDPSNLSSWQKKYAFPPTPFLISSDRLRLFLAFCDADTQGRIGFVDVDPNDPTRVLEVSKQPVLDVGRPGTFDEHGLLPTCVIAVRDEVRMYYVGYQRGFQTPYHQFAGLAISRDGGQTFARWSEAPIIDRSDGELHHRTSTFVMPVGTGYRMWYVGGSSWSTVLGKQLPIYPMRCIDSPDGLEWPRHGQICMDFASEDEIAFGRPWVTGDVSGCLSMHFSMRRKSIGYRIESASSLDGGISWERHGPVEGLGVSPEGWDSEMTAYAALWDTDSHHYALYNGNGCGATGFGIAVRPKTA